MQHLEEALDEHFCRNVLASATQLQSICPTTGTSTPDPSTTVWGGTFAMHTRNVSSTGNILFKRSIFIERVDVGVVCGRLVLGS